jgi:hypothetical protein
MDPLSVDIGGNDPVAVLRANYSVEIEPIEDRIAFRHGPLCQEGRAWVS